MVHDNATSHYQSRVQDDKHFGEDFDELVGIHKVSQCGYDVSS